MTYDMLRSEFKTVVLHMYSGASIQYNSSAWISTSVDLSEFTWAKFTAPAFTIVSRTSSTSGKFSYSVYLSVVGFGNAWSGSISANSNSLSYASIPELNVSGTILSNPISINIAPSSLTYTSGVLASSINVTIMIQCRY